MLEKRKKKIDIKNLSINILIPLCIGAISGFLCMDGMKMYPYLNKSAIAPPAMIFPLVWFVLYILMGISAYVISGSRLSVKKQKKHKDRSMSIYALQLAVNFFWPILFFNSQNYLFAFFWLVLLLVLVCWMTAEFWRIEQSAAYLQIPYIVWLIFAGYLNFTIYAMN